jgi:hypothetical protein
MLQAGVPATAAFVAIAVEVLAAWPVILLFAALLGWWFAPDWLAHAWPVLRSSVQSASGWVIAVLLATLLVGWLAARSIRTASHRIRRPLRRLARLLAPHASVADHREYPVHRDQPDFPHGDPATPRPHSS